MASSQRPPANPKAGDGKEQFGAIPVRAFSDGRLSASHFRLLGTIAYFDRFGRNGYGCIAGHRKLSETAAIHYTNIGRLRDNLENWGYLNIQPNPLNRRRRVYRVIYYEKQKVVGRSTNNDGAIVGEQNQQRTESNEESSEQYIGRSPFKKSCVTEIDDPCSLVGDEASSDGAPNIDDAPSFYDEIRDKNASAADVIPVEESEDGLQDKKMRFLTAEQKQLEKARGDARREIANRLGGGEQGWRAMQRMDDESLDGLVDRQVNGELTDADLKDALRARNIEVG